MSIESVIPPNHLVLQCPLLFLPSIFPSTRVFLISRLFSSGGQSIGASTSASVPPVSTQSLFSLGLTGLISLTLIEFLSEIVWCLLKSICCFHYPDKTVIQVYAQTSNTEEAEVERFYEDLQDLLELTPKKDVLYIIGDWNAKVVSQETPGVTGKFGFGMQNEAGQRLIEFCQENPLVIANTLF